MFAGSRPLALTAAFLAVLALGVGVPELLHLQGSSTPVTHAQSGPSGQPGPGAGQEVLSV